jgi:RHS repeat-associated protein
MVAFKEAHTQKRMAPSKPKNALRRAELQVSGLRYYNPEVARWISRDPIGERGGLNLQLFVFNSSINYADPIGLATIRREDCSVKAIFGHYKREWKLPPGDNLEFGVCQYIGIFTCFADRDHPRIPERNRIDFPSIPGTWPPLEGGVNKIRFPWEEVIVDRALEELSQAWCGVLKAIESCCLSDEEIPLTEKQRKKGVKPKKRWCCPKGCSVTINFDSDGVFEKLLAKLREELKADSEMARQLSSYGCEGLNDGLREKYWGDGLPPERSGRPNDVKGPGNICESLRP